MDMLIIIFLLVVNMSTHLVIMYEIYVLIHVILDMLIMVRVVNKYVNTILCDEVVILEKDC